MLEIRQENLDRWAKLEKIRDKLAQYVKYKKLYLNFFRPIFAMI